MCLWVQGCKNRDHVVNIRDNEKCDEETSAQIRVLNDLLLHRDAVCVSSTPLAEGWVSLCVCACMCVCVDVAVTLWVCDRSEDGPCSADKVPDSQVLIEPTLLVPLRGAGTAVSLCFCLSLQLLPPVISLVLSYMSPFSTSFPFWKTGVSNW